MKHRKHLNEQTETLSGARMAQDSEEVFNMQMAGYQQDANSEFSYIELKIAKRFVQLLGGKERATKAIEQFSTASCPSIDDIADMMPGTEIGNLMDITSMYNPSAIR